MPRPGRSTIERAVEVTITRRLPADAIVKPDLEAPTIQTQRRIRCPYCKSTKVRRRSHKGRIRYYRCGTCADPDTGDWTPFRVFVQD